MFLNVLVKKIYDNCCLKNKLTKAISALDKHVITNCDDSKNAVAPYDKKLISLKTAETNKFNLIE